MNTLLVVLLILAVLVILYLLGGLLWLRSLNLTKADHAKCVAHIASVTSNRVIALAFRDAAARWDSIEEKPDLQRIAREKYEPGGPSMPALWLNEQADKLDSEP